MIILKILDLSRKLWFVSVLNCWYEFIFLVDLILIVLLLLLFFKKYCDIIGFYVFYIDFRIKLCYKGFDVWYVVCGLVSLNLYDWEVIDYF